jgi:peptidoglycan/xylan/chitin deacetylase (PgdA/CDA1 family)
MKELVLCFHGVGQPHCFVGSEERPYWISVEKFIRILDQVSSFPNAEPRIVLTFDDGNASDFKFALPELSKRALTASFFLLAGRSGKKEYLDIAMIRDLLDAGMKIGSQGMEHRDWRTLGPSALRAELVDARRKLEDITQRPVSTVAIPFGSYDRRVLKHLMAEPWECIYTTDRGLARSQSMIKPRETIAVNTQDQDLLRRLSTDAPPLTRVRRQLSRLYKRLR